jgi:hypothetical protein
MSLLRAFTLYISFSLLCFNQLQAKDNDSLYYAKLAKKIAYQDTAYIKHYRDKLTLRLFSDSDINKFKVRYNENKTETYRPNNGISIGAGFYYKWVGFNVSYLLPLLRKDQTKYGKSSGVQFQTNVFQKKWTGIIFFQRYKGFYLDNTDEIYPVSKFENDDQVALREDITQSSLSIEYSRVFNYKKFSTRASIQQNEQQKKSAGSALLGGFLLIGGLSGDTSLISRKTAIEYQIKNNYNKINLINLGITGGYAHTFVFKKHFYTTISAELGFGVLQDTRSNSTKGRNKSTADKTTSRTLNSRVKTYFSLGYNGNKNFIGFSYINNNYNFISKSDINMTLSIGMVRLFVGRRF